MGAKLHFKYGSMNAGKSTTLLMIAHDYEVTQNKNVFLAKPETDSKGGNNISSRVGRNEFQREVDIMINQDDNFYNKIKELKIIPDVILIDEAQFLKKETILQLVDIVTLENIPIIAFGLRSDFLGKPFEGSSWLFALAQDIEEIGIRTICHCGSRSTMNLRLKDGNPTFEGEQLSIDGEKDITYETRCLKDYMKLYKKSKL